MTILAPALAALAMAAPAPGPAVSIGFAAYAPPATTVLTGDEVTWTNDSVRAHTVTAEDGSFDSGHVVTGATFARRFTAPGAYRYFCAIHPFMRGEVDVEDLLLDAPRAPAAPRRGYPLTGRAALAPGSTVTIEGDAGGGFHPAGTATVGPGGGFAATVTPTTTTSYRAVAGDRQSLPVRLLVLDRHVRAVATRHGRRFVVRARVRPAAPGATVVLQLHLRDRFGWWPVRRARLDRASRARFELRRRHGAPARVVLTLPDGATVLAVGPTLRLGH